MTKLLGIIGTGQMGGGIAYCAASVGKIPVKLFDSSISALSQYTQTLQSQLDRDVAKGRISATAKEQIKALISPTSSMSDLANVDFIIEAATESFQVKQEIFQKLGQVVADPAQTVVATNTSSISITKLASCYQVPHRFIGMHFMNPVPVMKLVEVIMGSQTTKETLEATLQLAEQLGKVTSRSADVPGFIANRLLMPYINEAIFALYEGIGTKEDIDRTMQLGTNMPMGPLALADLVGLDTCLSIIQVMHAELGDSKYRPCPLLVRYVHAGWLGRKSGKGFYEYSAKSETNKENIKMTP